MTRESVENGSNLVVAIIFVAIMLAVMILAVVLIVNAVGTANTSLNGASITTGSVDNETHYMNGTIGYFDLANSGLTSVSCVIPVDGVTNASDGALIAHAGNFTQSPSCRVNVVGSTFNNTNWNVTYTYSYDTTNGTAMSTTLTGITSNTLGMVSNFFSLMPTIGTILAVIILIACIVLLVLYVKRMKDSGQSERTFQG